MSLVANVPRKLAGKKIRSRWKRALSEWNGERCTRQRFPLDSDFDTNGLWQVLRARPGNGSRRYESVAFYGPLPKPTSREIMPRFGGKRLRPSQYRHWSSGVNGVASEYAKVEESLKAL